MCIVCKEWLKGNLTTKEAWQNLNEIIDSEPDDSYELNHYFNVVEKLVEAEMAEKLIKDEQVKK